MKNNYEIRGDVTVIFVKCNGETIETVIDTKDLQRVDEYPNSWYGLWKDKNKKFYVRGSYSRRPRLSTSLHGWLMGKEEGKEVDHIDRDTLNNRRSNLRLVSHSENVHNVKMRSDNTSGIKGVSWDKHQKKWAVQITTNKVRRRWFFKDIADAEKKALEERIIFQAYSPEAANIDVQLELDFTIKTGCVKGEKVINSKLTEEQVREIRSLYPNASSRKLAKQFNVSNTVILRIVNRKMWKHVV